jgi:hypothetical protein
MSAITQSQLVAYQAYVEKFSSRLMSKGLLEFDTAKVVAHMPEVKGRLVGTKMNKNGNLIRGFDATFQGYPSQELTPVIYETDPFKTEFKIIPTDIYKSYLGFLTTRGFKATEYPIQQYFFEQHMAGIAQEMEVAIWLGVKDGAAAADAPILSKMHGFGKRITDAIAAGNTPVVTGAITTANIIGQLQTMYDRIGKQYKNKKVHAFLSIDHQHDYFKARGTTLQYTTDNFMNNTFATANMQLHFVPGLPKNKVLVTIEDNLVYNYDGVNDVNNWYLDRSHYSIEGSAIMRAGTTIVWTEDAELVVNDQW